MSKLIPVTEAAYLLRTPLWKFKRRTDISPYRFKDGRIMYKEDEIQALAKRNKADRE